MTTEETKSIKIAIPVFSIFFVLTFLFLFVISINSDNRNNKQRMRIESLELQIEEQNSRIEKLETVLEFLRIL